jgi:5-enolpyruvylshikimate-3-phosphate synthase
MSARSQSRSQRMQTPRLCVADGTTVLIITPESVTVTGPADAGLHGVTVNMRDISDTMPTLAAIAPFAYGPVRIEDVYNTRVKECDRLEACAQNLRAMGVPVRVGRDWIEIQPAQPHPSHIACRGEHRIAMAFSLPGRRTPGITLDNPGCAKRPSPDSTPLSPPSRQPGDMTSSRRSTRRRPGSANGPAGGQVLSFSLY